VALHVYCCVSCQVTFATLSMSSFAELSQYWRNLRISKNSEKMADLQVETSTKGHEVYEAEMRLAEEQIHVLPVLRP
jgi:hypothetical protein